MSDSERLQAWYHDGQPSHVHDAFHASANDGRRESFAYGTATRRPALFEDYVPAYRAGRVYRLRHPNRSWAQASHDIGREWGRLRGVSRLSWTDALPAVQAAWEHVDPPGPDAWH